MARGRIEALSGRRGHPTRLEAACELFANQRDGVLKVAITP
jgi:hypothetical protein